MKTEILCFIAGFAFSLIPYYFDVKRLNDRNKQLEKENLEVIDSYKKQYQKKVDYLNLIESKLTPKQNIEVLLEKELGDKEQAINWTCVAILECGHELDSELVKKHNNLFGLHYANKPIDFKDTNQCIDYLNTWIRDNPNDKNLPFANYLIDKGWATDPNYIAKFNSVRENYGN